MELQIRHDDGTRITLKDPPEITKETLDKLDKTAYHLAEIAKMWNVPDLGIIDGSDFIETHVFEEGISGSEAWLRAFNLDWYQSVPFVPMFFNRSFYHYLSGKILDLTVRRGNNVAK